MLRMFNAEANLIRLAATGNLFEERQDLVIGLIADRVHRDLETGCMRSANVRFHGGWRNHFVAG